MTKKTRIRVARIAAGAVIAAGASLTAAGAASAVGVDINVGPLDASVNADRNGIDAGLGLNPPDPTDLPTVIPDPTPTEEPPPRSRRRRSLHRGAADGGASHRGAADRGASHRGAADRGPDREP